MNTLILLRHSLTRANEERRYCGWTDLPLSAAGAALAETKRTERPLPACDLYIDSGLLRANQTMFCLCGCKPDRSLPDLREIHFGEFEMLTYEMLKDRPDYQAWITDTGGDVPCPGGESRNAFHDRVARGGRALLTFPCESALAVSHGGVIATLMRDWFPSEPRHFYEWQPAACEGYRISIRDGVPARFEEV